MYVYFRHVQATLLTPVDQATDSLKALNRLHKAPYEMVGMLFRLQQELNELNIYIHIVNTIMTIWECIDYLLLVSKDAEDRIISYDDLPFVARQNMTLYE